jgi:GTP-binding protein EngB required for normal cell division
MPTESGHLTVAARWRVLRAIDELVGSAGELLAPRVIEELRAGRARLAQARFNLAVLGEFKRGKSTLINALLGREVLPTGVVPLTSMVTVICHGPRDRLIIHYRDGRETEHPVSELAHFATEHGNPHNRLGVELTSVELPAELLVGGLQLIDTPGIGSVHEHNTAVAWGFLPRVDAAVCVLTADQPFAQSEREFFAAAAARVPRLLIVVNKIDHLQRGERQVALEFIEGAADELLAASEVEYFALSAREGEGVARLSRRIAQLAERESHALLVRSVGRLTAVAARDAAQAIEFEAQAIELTLEELRRRAELFAARAQALRAARAEAADLLERAVERLLDDRVNQPLLAFAQVEADALKAGLAARANDLGRVSAGELGPALATWIDETIRRRFDELVPQLEASVSEEVHELQHRFARRIEEILLEVQDVAEDVFGSRTSNQLPEVDLSEPAWFSFKLEDVGHMLDYVVTAGRRAVPGPLGRRMAVRDAEDRLLQMADRHAGRLRSALVERVREAVTRYQRELSALVEGAVQAIEAAVQRAARQRSQGEPEVRRRAGVLEGLRRRAESLADELTTLVTEVGDQLAGAQDSGSARTGAGAPISA